VLECPVCASENVRVSFNTPFWEFVYRWQGLQRYRCRECRKIFHYPLVPGEKFATKPRRRRRKSQKQETARTSAGKWRIRTAEAVVFLLMVVVFYTALNALHFASGQ